jgi:hypothetical protein
MGRNGVGFFVPLDNGALFQNIVSHEFPPDSK